jgi:hypothetical protein
MTKKRWASEPNRHPIRSRPLKKTVFERYDDNNRAGLDFRTEVTKL